MQSPSNSEPADLAITAAPGALSPEYMRAHRLLPVSVSEDEVTVAASYDPTADIMDDLRVAFRVPRIAWRRVSEEELDAALEAALADRGESVDDLVRDLTDASVSDGAAGESMTVEDLTSLANKPPVVKLVNAILREALESRASDVHLECEESGPKLRFRVDGVLLDAATPPAHLKDALISRIKVMAGLDIAERRAPQDGRARLRLNQREIDVRVATLPSVHGESVVLRLLDTATRRLSLPDLGMPPDLLERFDRVIRLAHGIVLVTGPTGSGKTTTLYAALDRIQTGEEKIVTVEDPVEYRIAGVTQVQVNRAAGLTFATVLRSILRQDPDVILIGEMRDPETADVAVHAALTGHTVFGTVHTNDASTGVTRLLDLGVPGYLVSSSVNGILAQRLVRRICESCRQPLPVPGEWGESIGATQMWAGAGCERCRGTGYHGRIGLFELLLVDRAIREEILAQRGSDEIEKIARAAGMRTLREDGLAKVRDGLTTLEEVVRSTGEET